MQWSPTWEQLLHWPERNQELQFSRPPLHTYGTAPVCKTTQQQQPTSTGNSFALSYDSRIAAHQAQGVHWHHYGGWTDKVGALVEMILPVSTYEFAKAEDAKLYPLHLVVRSVIQVEVDFETTSSASGQYCATTVNQRKGAVPLKVGFFSGYVQHECIPNGRYTLATLNPVSDAHWVVCELKGTVMLDSEGLLNAYGPHPRENERVQGMLLRKVGVLRSDESSALVRQTLVHSGLCIFI